MNILITGITGFIGKNLYKSLLNSHNIFAVVRKKFDAENLEKESIKCFIETNEINDLINFINSNKIDGVIHLASCFLATHTSENIEELINSNVTFSTKLLESAIKAHVKWFINTGTFWQNYHSDTYNPANLYAATKEAFNVIAKFYVETANICFLTIKLNDTYGKNDTRKKLISTWLKIADTNEIMEMSAGEQLIDIVYIDDVLSAYESIINLLEDNTNFKELNYQEFGISSLKPIKLKDLALIFEKSSGKKLNIKWGAKNYRDREIMKPWNNFKIVPNWKPKITFEEGIKRIF